MVVRRDGQIQWTLVAGTIFTTVIIGLGSQYLVFFKDAVSRQDLKAAVQQYSPYVLDRGEIQRRLADIDRELQMLETEVTQHNIDHATFKEQIHELQMAVAKLEAKIK